MRGAVAPASARSGLEQRGHVFGFAPPDRPQRRPDDGSHHVAETVSVTSYGGRRYRQAERVIVRSGPAGFTACALKRDEIVMPTGQIALAPWQRGQAALEVPHEARSKDRPRACLIRY